VTNLLTSRVLSNVTADVAAAIPPGCVNDLLPHIYDELRVLAAALLCNERREHTLQVTALVHEAYLTLSKQQNLAFGTAESFLAAASVTIRRILVDRARNRDTIRRGAGWRRIGLENADVLCAADQPDILALNDALNQLEVKHPRAARVVELRYFGGMTIPEIADTLQVSTTTIDDDWAFAKAWLRRALRDPGIRADGEDNQ